jgi:serine/threonine-protein kinase
MSVEIGSRIGDYEILAILGSGGMGRVYKVRNIISNREEAMKILLPDFASDHDLAARLVAEIRTLAGLEHPNIAQLRTAFRDGNQFVMVMEYVEGTTLEKHASQGGLSLDKVIDYSSQALAALSYAHGRGVTHRDIKPANIMITDHGIVKLMDFGIAKSQDNMQLTRPGTTMGSVYYMSPEQVRGGTVDARSDIYSFGVTLYEMLTGRKPFQAETSYSVLNAQLNEAPTPPVQINPSLPPALNNIVMRAMVKAPEGRFQTAEEFRAALKALRDPQAPALQAVPLPVPEPAFASQAAPSAPPVSTAPPSPAFAPIPVASAPAAQPAKSHRGLWVGLGAAAAVLAVVAAFAVLPGFYRAHAGGQNRAQNTPDSQTPTPAVDATSASQANSASPSAPDGGQANPTNPSAPDANSTPATPANQADTSTSSSQPAPAPSGGGKKPKHGSATNSPVTDSTQTGSQNSTPAAPSGPSQQEVREAHDKYANIEARADAARQGVQQIRTQQQAQGLDIRGDVLAAMNRMTSNLREASTALDRDDVSTAHSYMERAEKDLSTIEAFLGR